MTVAGQATRPRKGALTRESILRAAQECFTLDSYDHVTLATIADKAKVNVALINRYFGTKEDLFNEAVVQGYHYPDAMRGIPPVDALKKLVNLSCHPMKSDGIDIVIAHLRSIAVEPAKSLLREGREQRFVAALAAILPGDQTIVRAELITALLFGVRTQRDIAGSTSLQRLSGDELAEWLTPLVLQLGGVTEEHPVESVDGAG